jgi:hypothetical protein
MKRKKRPLRRHGRWEDDIKMDRKEIKCKGVDSCGSELE